MPVYLTVTELVTEEVVNDLVADLAPLLTVDDVSRFGMRSAAPPEWIQIAADIFAWTFPLKAAATAYFVKFAQRAADYHWDHRSEMATFLKAQAGRPLATVAKAFSRARSRLASPRAAIVLSVAHDKDEMFGPSLAIDATDEEEIALQLARFITQLPAVAELLERHRASGTGPIGPCNIRFETDRAIRVEWMDASLEHHVDIIDGESGA